MSGEWCCREILLASQTVTDCECLAEGFCSRHNCHKTRHFYSLCKRDPRYHALWDNGRGPGQIKENSPDRPHIWFLPGSWLARLIHLMTFGYVTPCQSCNSRIARINGWGARLVRRISEWKERHARK